MSEKPIVRIDFLTDETRAQVGKTAVALNRVIGDYAEGHRDEEPHILSALITLLFVYARKAGMTQEQLRFVLEDHLRGMEKGE